jgi:hypothetical protein
MIRTRPLSRAILGLALLAATTALVTGTTSPLASPARAANGVPRPDHVVIAIFENKKANSIFGNSQAPYINSLANAGAKFTQSFAIEHPSEPNYLDLFSGSNQGVTDDSCPHTFSTDNIGAELIGAGLTFGGYSEGLPSVGSTTCSSGNYARKHNPWVNFTNVPSADNLPYTSFPTDYSTLPTVSWVVPDLCDDMHDCTIATGDTWLKNSLDGYAQWATTHNSLLIVTFDEDDGSGGNNIATLFYGQPVRTGTYTEHIDHFDVLRTIEDMYGLPYAGNAAGATPIIDVWTGSPSPLTVTNPGSQTGTVGTAISPLQLAASGGTSPYTWSVAGLPPGLTASTGGLVTGTPSAAGTYTITATATDSVGGIGSTSFSWTVRKAHGNH